MTVNALPLPLGFRTAGLHCGVKKDPQLFDLSLFVADKPATAAGVFTTNLVHGAPVKVSRRRVPRGTARGVVINSGNSNACTGDQGIADAEWMTAEVASKLGCAADDVLVCSTGVIGRFLPKDKLAAGIPKVVDALAASDGAFLDAARGIMTTDTFPKQATRAGSLGGKPVRISGVCKGAAMIAPNMATMLSVILTDVALTPAEADACLRHAVDRSFNCISVEGHMSTSDTVILLASGASGARLASANDRETFQGWLDSVAADLAQLIIRDAEGADHEIEIDVRGLRTRADAYRIAKAVADSPLVKTAITGADPNWGRIVSAVGYAGVPLAESDITLRLNGLLLYQSGTPTPFNAAEVSAGIRNNRRVHIDLEFPLGPESVRFWTCDLTAEYVRLNADYTT
ncbi:MAG: bifunctional glutamate N-acetyltransferase/amino-acid acetyltransferase ArgJ [Planctomycetota bacterium]|nr:bifunctional glutamate N-acetyltransferase/amino-acid acetyltransferase ArgJ [Planctomycetota bacterium]